MINALSALYERRWLALYFIQRHLSLSYKGSYLGFAWLFLSPLLLISLYTLVFSEIVGLRFTEDDSALNFGLYLYCGLLPFLAFSSVTNGSVNSVKANATLIQKVVFPLEILPLTNAVSALINQLLGFGVLIAIVGILQQGLNWTVLLLPLIAVPQVVFYLGVGLLATVAGAYLPDTREVMTAFVRAMLFATPIIWPAELARERGLGFIVDYNPLAFLAESYRDLVLEGVVPGTVSILLFTLFAGALCVGGFVLFVRTKRSFADLV